MNGLQLLNKLMSYVPLPAFLGQRPVEHVQFQVGAGFYAMRQTISAIGKKYFKLVKADMSRALNAMEIAALKLKPSVGKRTDKPLKHRARTNYAANK